MNTNGFDDRVKKIRKKILQMTTAAGSGHPGGSLSSTDILVTLYFRKLRHDPKNPGWPGRDRFILSKGHAAPLLYAVLAESGYFPEDKLLQLRKMGSGLEGHPAKSKLPGVEASTGSLGQGFSVAVGCALAGKLDSQDSRVYCLLGDGECQEGQVWEAAMAAHHYKLDNLTAIVDRNRLQIDGSTEDVMSLEPFAGKWQGFWWNVLLIDGHDRDAIYDAFCQAEQMKGRPTVIIANTIKGKGISFMENVVAYHGKPLTEDELEAAIKEME